MNRASGVFACFGVKKTKRETKAAKNATVLHKAPTAMATPMATTSKARHRCASETFESTAAKTQAPGASAKQTDAVLQSISTKSADCSKSARRTARYGETQHEKIARHILQMNVRTAAALTSANDEEVGGSRRRIAIQACASSLIAIEKDDGSSAVAKWSKIKRDNLSPSLERARAMREMKERQATPDEELMPKETLIPAQPGAPARRSRMHPDKAMATQRRKREGILEIIHNSSPKFFRRCAIRPAPESTAEEFDELVRDLQKEPELDMTANSSSVSRKWCERTRRSSA
jgi:hypothetical protein